MAKEILIADPDKADQEEFKRIFELAGFRLVFSENGEETLLRVKLFKPHLIIAGTGLGEMSGFELCEAVKTDPELKRIPVILLSSIFEEISKKDSDRVRADGVISKPFHEDEVLNLVDHLLEEEAMKSKEEFSLEGLDEMEEEEEIIELVDVVEEPEQRMSINDFVAPVKPVKEEPFREITPLESWEEKLEEEEKPSEKQLTLAPEEKEEEIEGMLLHLEKEVGLEKASPEDELFGKIELEEILQKVEKLRPSLEKEWPSETEERVSKEEPLEEEPLEEEPLMMEEPPEKYSGLEAFRAALQKEVKGEPTGEALQSLRAEGAKAEAPPELPATEIPLEEELKESLEEEFPAGLFEELGDEEIKAVEEPREERFEIFEEVEAPVALKEEIAGIEKHEELRIDELEELGFPKAIFEEPGEKESGIIEEPREERIEILQKEEALELPEEEIRLPLGKMEQQMGELIAKGVQEMMENFVTKIIPEMAQNILTLTVDRIEKMVREIVPDLAEKAIQEEIKRLQKGEKDQEISEKV